MNLDLFVLDGFDWNMGNLDHIKKHNVSDKECEDAFFNKPLVINDDSSHSKIEKRYRAYGKTANGRFLNIIFTIRNNKLRVISARDQNKKERREYLETGGVHN